MRIRGIFYTGACLALTVGFAVWATPSRADLKSGVTAYKAGDYKTALREFSKDAAAGNANAQFNLAILYLTGRGVKRDLSKAVEWHLKAAAQGLPAAEHGLGVIYYQGLGVKQDYAQALVWFRRAAAKGFADSEFNIGVMYFNSQGVRRDDFEVVKWVTLAASRKFSPAEFRMGQMYEKGVIFAKDLSAARHWYGLAAKHGDKNAPRSLARVSKALNLPTATLKPRRPAPSPKRKPAAPEPKPAPPAGAAPPAEAAPAAPAEKFAVTLPGRKIKRNTLPLTSALPGNPPAPKTAPDAAPAPAPAAAAAAAKPVSNPVVAPPKPGTPGRAQEWRVQLASFRTPGEARRAWARLSSRAGNAMDGTPPIIARVDLGDRGIFHRLQAGPLDGRRAAGELCQRIREAAPDQGCLPIRTRIP